MQHVRNSKKTLILAAVVSIMGLSFVSSSQTNAISVPLREIINNVTGNTQSGTQARQSNQTPSPQQRQTNILNNGESLVSPILNPDQPNPNSPAPSTPTTVTPTAPVQTTQTLQQTPAAQSQQTTTTPQSPTVAVTPVDTSAEVLRTANLQSIEQPAVTGTLYTSNKLDPKVAQYMLIAAILTVTAGFVLYGATVLPSKKRTRHIPVKSL
jgi:hypothetical protein